MDNRAFLSGAAGSAPSAPGSPSTGYPTGGNLATATPATNPGPFWFHALGEELRAVIVAGALTPTQGTLTQVRDAIQAFAGVALISGGVPYGFKIGPLIVQFGTTASFGLDTNGNAVTFRQAFPTACLAVFPATNQDHGVNTGSTNYAPGAHTYSTTGFILVNDSTASTFVYVAFGY